MEAELQIFTGQVERNCGSGTSDIQRPGRAELQKRNFRSSKARYSGIAEDQLFTSQVERKFRSGTSDLHRPGRAEVRNFRSSHVHRPGIAEMLKRNFRFSKAR